MTNNLKLFVLTIILLAFALAGCERSENKSIPANKGSIWDITEPSVTPGWITFKQTAKVNPKTVFKDYADLFQLPAHNEMKIVSEENDETGMTHYRFQQLFQNIPVEHAEFMVHAKQDLALTANGELALNFSPPTTTPTISEQQALQVAMDHIPAKRYFQEDNLVEDLKNADSENAQSDYRPKGKLIFAEQQNTDAKQWQLAWAFKLYVLPLERSKQVYINAGNGEILKEIPLFGNCAAGSGDTTFRGNQRFNTKQANSRFYLTNDCGGKERKAVLLDTAGKAVDISDDDNNWIGNNRSLVTSYWALDIVYDYFRLVHGRTSYDNKDSQMVIYNNPNIKDAAGNLTPNNASGGGGVITIGFGTTNNDNDDYNTVDIVGHEFGHSLIESSAQLGYDATLESAALNESFSDILGMMTRQWEEKNITPTWVIGDEKGCAGGAICRDFKNPKHFSQPDTYKGTFWQTANIDPHVNGNVQNRWFYLLSNGGSDTNSETGVQYAITGIGVEKAGKIAYRSLTRYLTSAADYIAARAGSINAATDLYGPDSQEVGQVIKAWCAVGLCPYTQPKEPDRFDQPGGNPNPVSPDNNNNLAGATPLGTGGPLFPGKVGLNWSKDRYPKISVSKLSIFPFNDVDYFSISAPGVENPFGGRCTTSGYSFNFTNNINANIYSNGSIVASFTNTSSISVPGALNLSGFTISVSAVFPGQILDYNMVVAYFFNFDSSCYVDGPKSKWQLIQECVMCNFVALSPADKVVLDPAYRNEFKVPVQDYYFYHDGNSEAVDIPIQLINGNGLAAQLVDEKGNILSSTAELGNTNTGNVMHLKSKALSEGVYSLRFSQFGNGTEISVGLPSK